MIAYMSFWIFSISPENNFALNIVNLFPFIAQRSIQFYYINASDQHKLTSHEFR